MDWQRWMEAGRWCVVGFGGWVVGGNWGNKCGGVWNVESGEPMACPDPVADHALISKLIIH